MDKEKWLDALNEDARDLRAMTVAIREELRCNVWLNDTLNASPEPIGRFLAANVFMVHLDFAWLQLCGVCCRA